MKQISKVLILIILLITFTTGCSNGDISNVQISDEPEDNRLKVIISNADDPKTQRLIHTVYDTYFLYEIVGDLSNVTRIEFNRCYYEKGDEEITYLGSFIDEEMINRYSPISGSAGINLYDIDKEEGKSYYCDFNININYSGTGSHLEIMEHNVTSHAQMSGEYIIEELENNEIIPVFIALGNDIDNYSGYNTFYECVNDIQTDETPLSSIYGIQIKFTISEQ